MTVSVPSPETRCPDCSHWQSNHDERNDCSLCATGFCSRLDREAFDRLPDPLGSQLRPSPITPASEGLPSRNPSACAPERAPASAGAPAGESGGLCADPVCEYTRAEHCQFRADCFEAFALHVADCKLAHHKLQPPAPPSAPEPCCDVDHEAQKSSDYPNVVARIVAEMPAWERQYNLRVESYDAPPMPEDAFCGDCGHYAGNHFLTRNRCGGPCECGGLQPPAPPDDARARAHRLVNEFFDEINTTTNVLRSRGYVLVSEIEALLIDYRVAALAREQAAQREAAKGPQS